MLRWFLLLFASGFAVAGLLTVVRSPDWAPWRLAVLAGEYGYWLAAGPLAIAGAAWAARGEGSGLAVATTLVALAAAGLLLRPVFSAARVGRELPAKLAAAFGPGAPEQPAFSVGRLFARGPAPVPCETRAFAAGLALDFYRPPQPVRQPAPCVIVIHGGGWDSGDRRQMAFFNHWLARRGYAVAAISYRLAPKSQWPAQRDDTLAAIAYLKRHAAELGLDPARLVLLGRSAGGQIAQAVGYTVRDPAIRGVVALYAPADLIFGYVNTHEDDVLKSPALMRQFLGGTPDSARPNYESASAHYHVSRETPPTLLLHGLIDPLVWHRHSERLDARLAENGVPRAYVLLPWATHAFEYNLSGPGGQLTTFAVEWFLAAVTR